jgi:hypothetical protein
MKTSSVILGSDDVPTASVLLLPPSRSFFSLLLARAWYVDSHRVAAM